MLAPGVPRPWRRRDVFWMTFVSVALFLVIVGCSYVMNAKRGGGRPLWTLMEGAYIGGLMTLCAAALVALGAIFLHPREAIFTQIVISTLLIALNLHALHRVSTRIALGYEPYDSDVLTGQLAYMIAIGLQVVAVMIGVIRFRRNPA